MSESEDRNDIEPPPSNGNRRSPERDASGAKIWTRKETRDTKQTNMPEVPDKGEKA